MLYCVFASVIVPIILLSQHFTSEFVFQISTPACATKTEDSGDCQQVQVQPESCGVLRCSLPRLVALNTSQRVLAISSIE
jgi:hypothetical protein